MRASTQSSRLLTVDALRGLAVLLIFVSNIQEFALPRVAYFYPSVYGDFSGLNRLVWHFDNFFCNEKSLLLFGILFGASIVLADQLGTSSGLASHLRRSLFLLVVGLAHSYLVWDGDILVTLAVCGLITYPLRRQSPARLVLIGLIFAVVLPFLVGFINARIGLWPLEKVACFSDQLAGPPGTLESIIKLLRGGWVTQMQHRIPASLAMQGIVLPYYLVWQVSADMILGMVLIKSGFLSGRAKPDLYRLACTIAVTVGLPLTYLNLHNRILPGLPHWLSFYVSAQYDWWVALLVTGGWLGAVELTTHTSWLESGLRRLAAVGRLSLSNYLGQSLIGTTIFYGHGLGLFGRLERVHLMAIVIGVWGLQIALSSWWLRHWSLGPMEWALRRWVRRLPIH